MGLFGLKRKSDKTYEPQLLATQNGKIIKLEELNDGVFSEKILGDGFALKPISNEVYSPVSGVITQVSDTLHAYGITTPDGLEILVHIGLDTVELKGQGFILHVRVGQNVKAGDKIAEADISFITSKNYSTDTVVLITNIDKVKSFGVAYGVAEGGKTVAMTYAV